MVCIFGRIQLLEGKSRWEAVNRDHLAIVAPFVERVSLTKSRLDRNASGAAMYAWFVYRRCGVHDRRVMFIPPCRGELEDELDYITLI